MAMGASATIIIVIVCCGMFVCCLGAVGWVYRRQGWDEEKGVSYGWRPTNTQGDYMREVRQANHNGMMQVSGYKKHAPERSVSSTDASVAYPSRSLSRSEVSGYGYDRPYKDNTLSYVEEDPGYEQPPRENVTSYGGESYYTEYSNYEQNESQYYDYPSPPPKAAHPSPPPRSSY